MTSRATFAARFARLSAEVRRRLRPPRVLRPTRAGWLFLLIILGVGFAALNTGNNLLYLVLSLMLSFLVLSGVLSESALRGVRVSRSLPRELFAGRDNSVQLEVSNSQRRVTAFALVVEDRLRPAADGSPLLCDRETTEPERVRRRKRRRRRSESVPAGRCFLLRVGARQSETRRYVLTPAHRGPLVFAGFRVSTRFPFGLFLKYREIEAVEEALVYPEVVALRQRPEVNETLSRGDTALTRIGQGGVVSGLREFTEGDSMRRVHWRSSLRRGSLLVSETEDDRDAEVEVRLRSPLRRPGAALAGRSAEPTRSERFEQAVSRAASEVVGHLQDGLAVGLRTDADFLGAAAGLRQRARLLSFLARVTPDGRTPASDEPEGGHARGANPMSRKTALSARRIR